MVRTFAGMLVILALSTLVATESRERLQTMYLFHFDKCNCTELAGRITLEAKRKSASSLSRDQAVLPLFHLHLIVMFKLVIISYFFGLFIEIPFEDNGPRSCEITQNTFSYSLLRGFFTSVEEKKAQFCLPWPKTRPKWIFSKDNGFRNRALRNGPGIDRVGL
jgi:hypothetical protein